MNDALLNALPCGVAVETIELPADQNRQYGEWQRVAMANRHLANVVAAALNNQEFPIGLLANCNALTGMLAGLQRAEGIEAGRIGLIWIDAHADFNTPETTLSGLLGGMPVALAAGLCLHRLRETAGMTVPIEPGHIVMAGLRDVDQLERELLEHHRVQCLEDAFADAEHSPLIDAAGELAAICDAIYVHVDMDVLDPAEVPGHPLTVPGGPTSEQLAAIIVKLFTIPRICSLGIASTPPPALDPDHTARKAAQRLICAAMLGHDERPHHLRERSLSP